MFGKERLDLGGRWMEKDDCSKVRDWTALTAGVWAASGQIRTIDSTSEAGQKRSTLDQPSLITHIGLDASMSGVWMAGGQRRTMVGGGVDRKGQGSTFTSANFWMPWTLGVWAAGGQERTIASTRGVGADGKDQLWD